MRSSHLRQLHEAISGHQLALLQELTSSPNAKRILGAHLTELVEDAGAVGNLEGFHHLLSQARPDERGDLMLAAWVHAFGCHQTRMADALRKQMGAQIFDQTVATQISGQGWHAVRETMKEGLRPTSAQALDLMKLMNNPFLDVPLSPEDRTFVYEGLASQVEEHNLASLTLAMDQDDDARVRQALSQMRGRAHGAEGAWLLNKAARRGRLAWIDLEVMGGTLTMDQWAEALKEAISAKQEAFVMDVLGLFPEVLEGLKQPTSKEPQPPFQVVMSALITRASDDPSTQSDWQALFERVRALQPLEALYAAAMNVIDTDQGLDGNRHMIMRLPREDRVRWFEAYPEAFAAQIGQTEADVRVERAASLAGGAGTARKPRVRT